MRKLSLLTAVLLAFLCPLKSFSSNFYWVGGTGKWTDYKNHWATSSGGSTFHTIVPTSIDDVIFDASSFSGSGAMVTIDSIAYCKSMNWKGSNAPRMQLTQALNVFGSFALASGMSVSGAKPINFMSSSLGNTIDGAGVAISGSVNFLGTGSWYLTGTLSLGSSTICIINFTSGTLYTQGNSINTHGFKVDGSSNRTMYLSTSYIKTQYFSDSLSTNLIFHGDTAIFDLQGAFPFIFSDGNLAFYNAIFSGTTGKIFGNGVLSFKKVAFNGNGRLENNYTFDTLQLTYKKDYYLIESKTQTINQALIANGSCKGLIFLASRTKGTQATISSPKNQTVSYIRMRDIRITGSASYTATNAFSISNNSGWSFTGPTPQNLYWIGNSGKWSDGSHWSLTSGGSASGCVPNDSDNVFFNGSSFNTGGRLVIMDDEARCRDLSFAGVSNSPTFEVDTSIYVNGSLTLNKTVAFTVRPTYYGDSLYMLSNSNTTEITSNSTILNINISFEGKGTWTLKDSLCLKTSYPYYNIRHKSGTITTNGNNVNCYQFMIGQNGKSAILNAGASRIRLYRFSESWWGTGLGSYTVNPGTSNLELIGLNAYIDVTRSLNFYYIHFISQGTSYVYTDNNGYKITAKKLTFEANGTIHSSNTIDSIIMRTGSTLYLDGGYTQTTKYIEVKGNCKVYNNIQSTGGTATINGGSNSWTVNFAKIKDVWITGTGTYLANNSFDLGNNKKWIFSTSSGTDFYWIKGTGNWNDATHWSNTSGGTSVGCVPTDSDNVFFDYNSFASSSNKTVTLNVAGACRNMDWTGSRYTPNFVLNNYSLSISGSMTWITAMDVTSSNASSIYFIGNQIGNTINTGKNAVYGNIYFNGKGSWILQDSLNMRSSTYNGQIRMMMGKLDLDSHTIRVYGFYSSSSTNCTLICGSADITTDVFDVSNTAFNLNAGTSHFHSYANNGYIRVAKSLSFYNFTFENSKNQYGYIDAGYSTTLSFNKLTLNPNMSFSDDGACTFDTLKLARGKTYKFYDGTTYTIKNQLDMSGNCGFITLMNLYSSTTRAIISKTGTPISATNLFVQDIQAKGSSAFTASNSYDLGNNTGWTFTKALPRKFYWIGNTGSWSSPKHWSLTSGGVSAGCIPNDSDDVFFDTLSFTTSSTVTMDSSYGFRNMDWTGAQKSLTFYSNYGVKTYGSVILTSNLSWQSAQTMSLNGKGNHILNTKGLTFNHNVVQYGTGTYKLMDNFNMYNSRWYIFYLFAGTFNTNGYTFKANSFKVGNSADTKLILGSSNLYLESFSDTSNFYNFTFSRGTSDIYLTATNSYLYSYKNLSFWNVYFTKKATLNPTINAIGNFSFNKLQASSSLTILNTNTYDTLLLNPGSTYNLGAGKTQNVKSYLFINGSPSGLTLIQSTSVGTRTTISKSSGIVCVEFVYLKDNIGTGGASFTAGNSSVSLGNNLGWVFNRSYSCLPRSITTSAIAGNNYCPGALVKVPYTISGVFNPNNNFIAQLSDSSGSFFSPDSIGFKQTANADTIYAHIPYNILPGTGYRIRVIADGPSIIGTDNGSNKTILEGPAANGAGADKSVCKGLSTVIGATAKSGSTYSWKSIPSGFSDTLSMDTVKPSVSTMYIVTETLTKNGCARPDSVNVKVNPLPTVLTGGNKSICVGTSTTIGTPKVSGFLYNWKSNPSGFSSTKANPLISPAVTTTYILTVTDSSTLCQNTDSLKIMVVPAPIADAGKDTAICFGQTITLGKVAVAGYAYSWKDLFSGATYASAKINVSPSTTRFYTLNISGGTCFSMDTVLITVNPLPISNAGLDKTICNKDSIQVGTASASGLTYQWISNPIGFSSTIAQPFVKPSITTTYGLIVTNSTTNCSATDSVKIKVNPLPIIAKIKDSAICIGNNIAIGGTSISGFTYSWTSKPSGFTSTLSNPIINPIIKTVYYISETNTSTTCKSNDSIVISVNPLPVPNTGIDKTICLNDSTIISTKNNIGNSYFWKSTPSGSYANSVSIKVSPSITTSFYVKETINATGCFNQDTIIVNVNPLPIANAGINSAICLKDSISIGMSAISGFNYSWTSIPSGFTSSISNPKVSPSIATTYILKATNISTGCINTDSVDISVNPLPLAQTNNDTTICLRDSVALYGGATISGNTYSWTSKPTGFISSIANPIVKPLITTTYYLTETISATGCKKMDSIIVKVNPLPTPNAGADKAICLNDSTILSTIFYSGNNYQWNILSSIIIGNTSSITIKPIITQDYVVTETINSTGCKNSDTIKVTVNPLPIANAGIDKTICFKDSVKVGSNPISGFTYIWSSIPIGFSSTKSNPFVKPNINTDFIVKITKVLTGCSNTDTMTVKVNPLPIVDKIKDTAVCYGTTISIGGASKSGNTYAWTSKSGTFSSTQANPSVLILKSDVYYLTQKTTSTGCVILDSVVINMNALPIAKAGKIQNICLSQTAQLGASKIKGYLYSWTSNPTGFTSTLSNPIVAPLVNTTYFLQVTDSITGCIGFDTSKVLIFPVIAVNTGNNKAICIGDSVMIGLPFVSGNSYQWTSNPLGFNSTTANPIVKPILTTKYTLEQIVTSTGCKKTDTVEVTVNPLPIAFGGNDTTICNKQSVIIGASATLGYVYQWTSNPTGFSSTTSNPTVNPSISTDFKVLTTISATGCFASDSVSIKVNPLPMVGIIGGDTFCQYSDAKFIAQTSGLHNQWKLNGNIIQSGLIDSILIQPSLSGLNILTLTQLNGLGCQDSISKNIFIETKPIASIIGDSIVCDLSNKLYIAHGGVFYNWTVFGNSGTPILSKNKDSISLYWTLGTGRYVSTIVKSTYGCSDTAQMNIKVNPLPTPMIKGDTSVCFNTASINYHDTILGSKYIFNVSNGVINTSTMKNDTLIINWKNSATTNTLRLIETNKFGCVDSTFKNVSVLAIPTVSLSAQKSRLCAKDYNWISTNYIAGATYNWTVSGASIIYSTNKDSVQLTWSSAGIKSVSVKVILSTGCTDSQSMLITVDSLPTPSIGAKKLYCYTSSDEIYALGKSTSSYVWKVSNVSVISGLNNDTLKLNFNNTGKVDISLIETNTFGCKDSISITTNVPALPKPNISGKSTLCEKESANYIALYYPKSNIHWKAPSANSTSNFTKDTININYSSAGKYDVWLIENDSNNCTDSVNTTITVNPLPIIALQGDTSICENILGKYFYHALAGSVIKWKTSGASIKTGGGTDSITTQFPNAGKFNIKAIETTSLGCKDSNSITANVLPKPNLIISGADSVCAKSTNLYLRNTPISGTFSWSVDSGAISYANNDSLLIKWSSANSGNIHLQEKNTFGCSDSISHKVVINSLPNVNILGSKDFCGYDSSSFTSTSLNVIKIWKLASNAYLKPLTNKQISLSYPTKTGSNDTLRLIEQTPFGCYDSTSIPLHIRALPKSTFNGDTLICNFTSNPFIGDTLNTTFKYTWSQNGKILNSIIDTLTFNAVMEGKSTIKLLIQDTFGCSDSSIQTIEVFHKPNISISGTDTLCQGIGQYKISGDTNNVIYNWDWKVGNQSGKNINPINITWKNGGTEKVIVTVSDIHGCLDTASMNVIVHPNPTPTFMANNACIGANINFMSADTSISTFKWLFGDGDSSLIKNPTHKYNMAGTYSSQLFAKTRFNCNATFSMPITIYANPKADFAIDSFCQNIEKNIRNLSLDNNKNTWYLNGTFMSNAISPKLKSSIPRTFAIDLQTTNINGCKDSIHKQIVIKPLPNARFGNFKQLPVNTIELEGFYTYPNVVSYKWEVDTIMDTHPTLLHTQLNGVGFHKVKRTLMTDEGCLSSYDSTIEVKFDATFGLRIYPNPFDVNLNVAFTLQENTKVIVIIYDMRGREIYKLLDMTLPAGQYKYDWVPDEINLSQSIYMLRFMAGDKVLHEKLVHAR